MNIRAIFKDDLKSVQFMDMDTKEIISPMIVLTGLSQGIMQIIHTEIWKEDHPLGELRILSSETWKIEWAK